jgi:hypothetical protein
MTWVDLLSCCVEELRLSRKLQNDSGVKRILFKRFTSCIHYSWYWLSSILCAVLNGQVVSGRRLVTVVLLPLVANVPFSLRLFGEGIHANANEPKIRFLGTRFLHLRRGRRKVLHTSPADEVYSLGCPVVLISTKNLFSSGNRTGMSWSRDPWRGWASGCPRQRGAFW